MGPGVGGRVGRTAKPGGGAGFFLSVVVTLLATACGNEAETRTTVPDLAEAAEATMHSTLRFQATHEPVEFMDVSMSSVTEGEIDFARRALHATLSQNVTGVPMSAGELSGVFSEFIAIDRMAYMRDDDGIWRSAPIPHDIGTALPFVPDVAGELERLRKMQDGEFLGSDEVRGVAADHYRFEALDGNGTVEMWIEAHGRVVRMRTIPDPPPPISMEPVVDGSGSLYSASQMSPVSMTYEFWAFGEPVDITAPADAVPCDLDTEEC